MMINLNQIVEHFLDEALRLCGDEGEKDEAVIRFLNDRNQGTDARRTEFSNGCITTVFFDV